MMHQQLQNTVLLPCYMGCESAVLSFKSSDPLRKIALNFNGEVNYRELAWRPRYMCIMGMCIWSIPYDVIFDGLPRVK